jgi:beta-lactamase superfamily II metal-dependent hydrolase
MNPPRPRVSVALALAFCLTLWCARARAATLDIYWIDVEGGSATLLVTPAHESVLIDTGWAFGPSAQRIHAVATQAHVKRIDYLIVTHFHRDHYGGAAGLGKLMPIGVILDNGEPTNNPDGVADGGEFLRLIQPYHKIKAERREIVTPGEEVPLRQTADAPPLRLRIMGARQHFYHGPNDPVNAGCDGGEQHPLDTTDNKNSIVSLLSFGSFKFFDGGDLTWNTEKELVCPVNSIGEVDVYQVDHHGVDLSNNPLLVRALAPVVTVMNNGPHKGGAAATLATLRATPSIQTMYQLHKDLRGGKEFNTDDPYIANVEEKCAGNFIKCSVDASAKTYTVTIPAKGFEREYRFRNN